MVVDAACFQAYDAPFIATCPSPTHGVHRITRASHQIDRLAIRHYDDGHMARVRGRSACRPQTRLLRPWAEHER